MNNITLSINASICRSAAKEVEGLENKVKASMRCVRKEDWMGSTDDELFRAAIGGALLDVGWDSEDGVKLVEAIEAIKSFNAFLSAAGMGLNPEVPEIAEDILPLMRWWEETKTKESKEV